MEELLSAWEGLGAALAGELPGRPSALLERRLAAMQDAIDGLRLLATEDDQTDSGGALRNGRAIGTRGGEALEGVGRAKTKKQAPGRHDLPGDPAGYTYVDGALVPRANCAPAEPETEVAAEAIVYRLTRPSWRLREIAPQIRKAHVALFGHCPGARRWWEGELEYLLAMDALWREEDAARERRGEPSAPAHRLDLLGEGAPTGPATGAEMLAHLERIREDFPPESRPDLPAGLTAEILERLRGAVGLNPGRPKRGGLPKRSARSAVDQLAKELRRRG